MKQKTQVLVTGATGFVGKRLILQLLKEGHEVYALCRIKGTALFAEAIPHLHYVWGDLRNPSTLENLPQDLDAAYYLVHSMSEIVNDLAHEESNIARQFIEGIKSRGIKQIIYLGGIINDKSTLSPHMRSRLNVEEALRASGIPTTVLRASIIIGSGSASFEIIRDLCEKLPIMIAPKWVHTRCQPIAIQDVLFYLTKVLLNPLCLNKTFDIGGPEVLTFKELMLRYADYRHLKRWILDVPFLTPRLSSYWLVFITSVRFSLCSYLVESMKSSSVVQLNALPALIPHQCLTYDEALDAAIRQVEQHDVASTWMDSWEIEGKNPNIADYIQVPIEGCLRDEKREKIKDSKESALDRIWRIGGDTGYYGYEWAWTLRGWIDRMIGGIGLNRGRRHPSEIVVGDSIDFWRVLLADKDKGHLILFATMKVPGEAWLEFRIEPSEGGLTLVQTATFRPRGLAGRLYWYAMYPFHVFIFHKMARTVAGGN